MLRMNPVVLLLCLFCVVRAQDVEVVDDEFSVASEVGETASNGRKWVIIPVPMSNPTLGTGLGLMTQRV